MVIIFPLQLLIIINIYLLLQYILKGEKKYRRRFILLLLTNIYLILTVFGVYIFLPSLFEDVDSSTAFWFFCGLLMILTLNTKIQIFRNISRRNKRRASALPVAKTEGDDGKEKPVNPLEEDLTTTNEMLLFIGSMPFFLISTAYFFAKIISFLVHDEF